MLDARRFVVKERVKLLAAYQTYDLYDPDSSRPDEPVAVAEEKISGLIQMLRWVIAKQLMPTRVEIREKPDDSLVFSITRGVAFFRPRVEIYDAQDQMIGYFKSKLFSFGGGFWVHTPDDKQFAEVKGNFTGFNYQMLSPGGSELGTVTKKLSAAGLAKELFTSADTYTVEVAEDLSDNPMAKMLVLAAALAIDVVFKSR
ncbi:MAG: phospholipid scramblase-related protein [Fimbriiglobus sp.]